MHFLKNEEKQTNATELPAIERKVDLKPLYDTAKVKVIRIRESLDAYAFESIQIQLECHPSRHFVECAKKIDAAALIALA